MSRPWFNVLLVVILGLNLILRLLPAQGNNFYFTMDQGNDAVHVREILVRHPLPLLGPETSIFGLYAGPLWYYFIAIGYWLFAGHPFGAVFMLILLSTVTLAIIVTRIAREVSPKYGVIVGFVLLTSWWFYDPSRYAFNPFPMLTLATVLIFWLGDSFRGQWRKYLFSAGIVGLAFHTDIASALALMLFYLLVSGILLVKHRIKRAHFLTALAIISLFLLPHFMSEIRTNFSQFHTLVKAWRDPSGVFSQGQLKEVSNRFYIIISRSTYRQTPEIGVLLFCLALIQVFRRRSTTTASTTFVRYFIILTLLLFATSWLFFITSSGWRDWQTSFLSPLVFLSFLLALTQIPKPIATVLLAMSLYSHVRIFAIRYAQNFLPTDDPSLLVNEISAVDWVYQKANGDGFTVYAYLPSVYDYPYQYLFWWHGLEYYHYLPCEYASYPGSPKLFLPNSQSYSQPTIPCTNNFRFLIIEPDKNTTTQVTWFNAITQNTALIEETNIGKIKVQKRLISQ